MDLKNLPTFEENTINALAHTTHNVYLWSEKPGISKTHTVQSQAKALGVKLFSMAITKQMSGQGAIAYLNRTEGDGGYRWFKGLGLQAWEAGGWLLMNDFHNIGPDMLAAFYQLGEKFDSAEILTGDGKVHRPKAGFRIVATGNIDPDVQFKTQQAVIDRFPIRINFPKPPSWALEKLDKRLHGLVGKYTLRTLYSIQETVATGLSIEKTAPLYIREPNQAMELATAWTLASTADKL